MTEFYEDRDLKKRMSRRNWRESKLGRRCRIAMLLLVLAAPLCAMVTRGLIVSNLKPAKLAGIMSEGMLLAAGDGDLVSLLSTDKDVPAGTPVH